MITTILLIRHGQTDWNRDGRWQGHNDIPLNQTGIEQAQALAQRLTGWPVTHLYSSDLQRAAQTATILGQTLGIDPVLNEIWRERDVGLFSGLTSPEVAHTYPDAWARRLNGILEPPEGESYEALHQRAGAALDQLLARHNGDMIAVISHGALLHAVAAHVLGIEAGQYNRISFRGNTGLTVIEANDGYTTLVRLNDTSHLE
ncbi:MAG: histidine phosphatase family protein [Chloroflexota bacterium]|jgi:broad specificity phosphatase PhoE